jgi:hypothetical protein
MKFNVYKCTVSICVRYARIVSVCVSGPQVLMFVCLSKINNSLFYVNVIIDWGIAHRITCVASSLYNR